MGQRLRERRGFNRATVAGRQQNSTDYLGRAATGEPYRAACLKLTTDCEATEKWIALIEPTREEPEYYEACQAYQL